MGKNKDNIPDGNDNPVGNYAKYSGIAFQMVAIIGIFTFVGYEIDQHAHNDPQWVTALLSLTGVCLSIFFTIRQLKK